MALDWSTSLHSIHVSDLNADGRLDLTLTDHLRDGGVVSHYQTEAGDYGRRPPLPNVGYHPNSATTFYAADGRRFLIVNAEGSSALNFYPLGGDGVPQKFGRIHSRSPNESLVHDWPGWESTLVVAALAGATVRFYPDLDRLLEDLSAAEPVNVPADIANTAVRSPVLAQLADTPVPSVVATMPVEGLVIAMTPQPDRTVTVQPLWRFDLLSAPRVVRPVELGGASGDDLLVLSETTPVVWLLLSAGDGSYNLRTFELGGRTGSRAGTVTTDADGTVLLWAGREEALSVLRWTTDTPRDQPVIETFERPGEDTFILESGDMDNDGHDDLVLSSSLGFVPTTVVYGPLAPKVGEIGAWLQALKAYEEAVKAASVEDATR